MKNVFRSKYQITQKFKERPEYYKQFGLAGHEGIDLIPTGSVWDVLCLADGVVVKDEDNAKSGAYGINITVWHPTLKRATQYCHLKENYVNLGDKVTVGQKLGLMGATGNTSGAHLHLNLFEVDDKGVRLNRDNGYFGGIDPLPFLEANDTGQTDYQRIIEELRLDRDKNWQLYISEQEAKIKLEDAIAAKQKTINALTKEIDDEKKRSENTKKELLDATGALQELRTDHNNLITEMTGKKRELEKVLIDLDLCKSQRKDLDKWTTKELVIEILGRIFRRQQ